MKPDSNEKQSPSEIRQELETALNGLSLRDPRSREMLLHESPDILSLALRSRGSVEFIGLLAKLHPHGKSTDFRYDHVLDFLNAKSKQRADQRNELAKASREHVTETLFKEPKAAIALVVDPLHGNPTFSILKSFSTFLPSREKQDRWVEACAKEGGNLFFVREMNLWHLAENRTGQPEIDLVKFSSFSTQSLDRIWEEHNPLRKG